MDETGTLLAENIDKIAIKIIKNISGCTFSRKTTYSLLTCAYTVKIAM